MATDRSKLPEKFTLDKLRSQWDMCNTSYTRTFRRVRILDATDRSKMWEAVNASFPSYQLLPDTNFVSYVKNNLMASLYTVGKSAQLIPYTEEDKQVVAEINTWLEHHWDTSGVGYYQLLAGERAALTNLGITQVGWDTSIMGGRPSTRTSGAVSYKNIDPTKFMRDPYAEDLDSAGYCMTWDELHVEVLRANPLYADTIEKALAEHKYSRTTAPVEMHRDRPTSREALNKEGSQYYRLIQHWVRDGNKVHEIHTLDDAAVLYVKEDIKPSAFPFAMLYCNLPAGDVIGTSEPARIFANSLTYNLMMSLLFTADYRSQRPPRFLTKESGINAASFIRHGNEADRTFLVNGIAKNAVHYHEFPVPSQHTPGLLNKLGVDIQQITGVDGRYTGKDTGSILTTGGIEAALDQATLIDAPKISNYEEYTRRLTHLTLQNMIEHGQKRKYFVSTPSGEYKTLEIDFQKVDMDTLAHYSIHVSSELPKNKARIAQTANMLMEKQMQYSQTGQRVNLITPEEWLMLQDLPIKELMQKRMGIQRTAQYTERVSQILFTFAGMVNSGVDPQEAIALTAQEMQAEELPGEGPDPRDIDPEAIQGLTMP